MSERVKWIKHKNENILITDYSNLPENEYIQELDETIKTLNEAVSQGASYFLVLTDVSNTLTTDKVTKKARECTQIYKTVKAVNAILGVTGFKKVIANMMVSHMRIFENESEAKDWLVSESLKLKK